MNPTSTSVPIPAIAGPMQLFNGDHGTPFLAPRGVCLTENHLIVADTGQNRVFIWNNRQHMETHRRPDVVLGQSNTSGTARNQGNAAGPATLQYPSGIWSDGNLLLVADAWNHRVLIWRRMPLRSDQAADVVIGQPDFEANQPNVSGLGKPPSARSLYWPYGVWSDGQRIWIADTGNRRALYYENIPD